MVKRMVNFVNQFFAFAVVIGSIRFYWYFEIAALALAKTAKNFGCTVVIRV
jgi:hypothetical protein